MTKKENELDNEIDNLPDGKESKEGLTFHPFKLITGVVISFFLLYEDWELLLSFAIVFFLHELGHVIVGKSFGCVIEEMQVFLLSFVSYKPKYDNDSSSWKNIKWSLGTLPLGGFTTFKTLSIESKTAWQRLLIFAGGIKFNFATFFILYFFTSYLPSGWYDICNKIMIVSLVAAVLNILPIFPLDGGRILFSCYEMITGKKPASWFVSICGIIGFIFIIIFFWIFPEWIHDFVIQPILNIFLNKT